MTSSHRNIYFLPLGLLLAVVPLNAQDYTWPTEAGRTITATFGDMRPRRYHSGFDISTNGGRGYEIYAVDGGYIERLLVSTQGYGKVIYLRLQDRRVVVYAHLQRFTQDLERLVYSAQQRRNRYTLDLRFKSTDLPVRQGDILGYTGDTGSISGPHLHFEIRDSRNQPMNPMQNGFTVEDDLRPVITSLAVMPLSLETVAHGSSLPTILAAVQSGPGSYRIADTIAVTGPFGLALEAHDRIPETRYNMTVYGVSLMVDGRVRYSLQFDRYKFQEGPLVELERDYGLWRRDGDDFHRLFVSPDSKSISFIKPGSLGALELSPGYHRFAVKTWDQNGNVAVLRGVLANTPSSSLEASQEWSSEERGWIITLDSSTPLRKYDVFFFDIRGRQVETFSHRSGPEAGKRQRFLVPRQRGRNRVLQIVGVDRWGARLAPVHVSLIPLEEITQQRTFTLKMEQLDNGVVLQVSSDYYLPFGPEVLLRTAHGVRHYRTAMVSPVDFITRPLRPAELVNLEEVIVRVPLDPVYEVRLPQHSVVVPPNEHRELQDPEGYLHVEFRPGTFYDSTLVWYSRSKVKPPPGTEFVTPPVQIGPLNRPYKGPMGLSLMVPPNQLLPASTGIYYLDRKKGWIFMPPAVGVSRMERIRTRAYNTLATSGEIFALIKETDPPVIQPLRPGPGGTYPRRDLRSVRFNVRDEVSGLKDETAISLTIDGVPRIFEYNTNREVVNYTLPVLFDPGEHELVITAVDQVGNTDTVRVTFNIE
ncbi:MAG: M23 family metallopeptidase [Candidatus Marinimicrobia bacterium]|nr:M23 family metallopeptidase [Candidatus Neomarinimicrobiota bacterium]